MTSLLTSFAFSRASIDRAILFLPGVMLAVRVIYCLAARPLQGKFFNVNTRFSVFSTKYNELGGISFHVNSLIVVTWVMVRT